MTVPGGAIYYCSSRVRREVVLDDVLRVAVQDVTKKVRVLLAGADLPPAVNDQRCAKCSLIDSCMPQVVIKPQRFHYYRSMLFQVDREGEEYP